MTVAQPKRWEISDQMIAMGQVFRRSGLDFCKIKLLMPDDQWQQLLQVAHDREFETSFVCSHRHLVIGGITFIRDSA